MPSVRLHGAFSIANTGDQLLQVATRQALKHHAPDWRVELSAPQLPDPFWRHRWDASRGHGVAIQPTPIDPDGWSGWTETELLVLGGGGLISRDPRFAAFFPTTTIPTAWNAIGFHHAAAIDGWTGEMADCITRSARDARYCSVRDRRSAELLADRGVTDVAIVPDPCLALELPAFKSESNARRTIGISPGRAFRLRPAFATRFLVSLDRLAGRYDCDLVFFAFTPLYDPDIAAQAAEEIPRARFVTPTDALDTWRRVGELDGYITSRYHGAIAALAQRVPLLVIDEYRNARAQRSKLTELFGDVHPDDVHANPNIVFPFDEQDDADQALEWLFDNESTPTLDTARQRLDQHWHDLVAALDRSVPS
ncbi:MAG: polysaccharide pyruvyl transferase family protein [Acidobacteriota bacterium]